MKSDVDIVGVGGYVSAIKTDANGDDEVAFTTDNTEGYTQAQLEALNTEIAARLADIDPENTDARDAAERAFADEVSRC